jgi:phage shock protein E
MNNLTCDDIRRTLKDGAVLLDVRDTDEFHCGALTDAQNMPLAILPQLADEQLDKESPVLVYCRAGARAIMAEKILLGLGFSDVTNIGSIAHFKRWH